MNIIRSLVCHVVHVCKKSERTKPNLIRLTVGPIRPNPATMARTTVSLDPQAAHSRHTNLPFYPHPRQLDSADVHLVTMVDKEQFHCSDGSSKIIDNSGQIGAVEYLRG